MNDIYSFYQLISKYQIETPIIQRDYAQGRNNPKAEDIRKSMVSSMIKSVTEDESSLFFDFVYGRIDGNKFIPFDGQQRLTTLFLFHKYVFEKCQSSSACHYKSNCICNDILLRFTYATRQSSREFCKQLVSHSVIPSIDYHKRIKDEYFQTLKDKQESEAEFGKKADEYVAGKTDWTSGFIKNQSWFYSDWEKDPTIMGMLTMLDEIHNQFTKKEINDYKPMAEKLTSGCSCPITFHFVDMGEHKLSDETYVKMNARGKALTPFENFKASLEQYLEEKKESILLSRLKGIYNEEIQKYTGIDGTWLDLFWIIANEGKKEKELPDTLMMSFFNRHLMNVWRCWYENKTKSENERKNSINDEIEKQKEYDNFNKRIVAEMPLYPTKDDFVSWDIYQNVFENCGVDECLTPIFNIWDDLCNEQENIIENSQSVWNRGKGKAKWNLNEGTKNNENRETYPSRVAFYALLRYFGVKKEETKTTLAQWMRIVWNIIENSTIDSPDSYQAALRLMNKLSEECHDIHTALANDFESFDLGNKYHAEEQVAEEIAKAKQILNKDCESCKKYGKNGKQTWEDVIIEAESYAFFKGAIRFLYTDGEGNINWCDFDVKWTNAQKYFDDKGVKDDEEKYRTNASLLKAVLYHVEDFWKYIEPQKYVFDNKAETWKSHILLEDGWEKAVHQLLMGNLVISSREGDCLIYKNLYGTNLLNYVSNDLQGSRIRWIHGHRAIYPPYYEGIILDDENRDDKFYRNRLLSSNDSINSEQKIEGLNYYKGWDINFKYKNQIFQWNTDEKVYLLESGKRKQKNESESYCVDVTNLNDSQDLINKLEDLIAQASPE